MCQILVIDDGQWPSWAEIDNATAHNPHGGGVAYALRSGFIRVQKGLTDKGFARAIVRACLDKRRVGAVVAHARISTAGGVQRRLTHPFRASPDAKRPMVLFTNGHLGAYDVRLRERSQESDASLLAEDMRACADTLSARVMLTNVIDAAPGNRAVLLDWRGVAKRHGSGWVPTDWGWICGCGAHDIRSPLKPGSTTYRWVDDDDDDAGYGWDRWNTGCATTPASKPTATPTTPTDPTPPSKPAVVAAAAKERALAALDDLPLTDKRAIIVEARAALDDLPPVGTPERLAALRARWEARRNPR